MQIKIFVSFKLNIMAALSLFLTREKAVRYFKEQGFTFTGNAVSLVLSKDGKTIGWYYAYLGTFALSTKAYQHKVLEQPLSGYKIIYSGQVFLYDGQLCTYAMSKIASKSRPVTSFIIRRYSEVLQSSELKKLEITRKTYHCYGVFNKDTNKMVTCIWLAGNPEAPEHYHPVFQKEEFTLTDNFFLKKFNVGDEFKFEGRYWMVNTHLGAPCLCEIDIDLRKRIMRNHNVKLAKIQEY